MFVILIRPAGKKHLGCLKKQKLYPKQKTSKYNQDLHQYYNNYNKPNNYKKLPE